jgi:hypothetical protein
MAPDDRDRNFEKALARHLRSFSSSGVNANVPAGAHAECPNEPTGELCPDPEILAAYHDGSLSHEERNLRKQHVVSCESCQLVLAHLETPLDVPVNLEINEHVAVPQQSASSGRAASSAAIARPSPLHSLRWLWLVPAGAIAATLIVWVSLNTPKPSPLAPPPAAEVAENRQLPAAPASTQPAPALPSESRDRKEKDKLAAPSPNGVAGIGSATGDLAANESQNQLQMTQRIQSQNAATPAHGPSLSQQKQQQEILHYMGGPPVDGKKLKAEEAGKLDQEGKNLASQLPPPAPPPPPPPPAPSFIADGSVPQASAGQGASVGGAVAAPAQPAPAPASKVTAPKVEVTNADTISGVTESVEVSSIPQSAVNGRAMMRAAALQNPHVFWAPGAKQAWRIGPAGSLEHSKDKGVTWTPQISGVYTDLLAGSAPSGKVCWIAGASGTILRTTDGGTHWSKLDSPITNNLTGIRATDATHAWIWFVPDQQTGLIKTYQTTDGGVTWSPVLNQ